MTKPAADGDLVQVKDHRQRLVGVGFYNSRSKIAVRMLAPERVEVGTEYFEARFREALAWRQRYLPQATSFRAVNAEGDLLSGLIVDKYEDVLVVQTSSFGMDRRKAEIVAALDRVFAPRAIYEKNDAAFRKFEGLEDTQGFLKGQCEPVVPVRLNGLQFEVPLEGGHKTGIYLDQQQNYQRVAEMVPRGAQVLDCFTFMGGFAIHAARAGATHVHGLDQSAEAVATATRLAAANGVAAQCSFATANVFDWLKANTGSGPHEKTVPKFDAIILDPPSFTRTRAAVPDALRGYKEIHLRALKLLKPGGLLATFCCSHHVDDRLFLDVILAAAYDARRLLRRAAVFTQAADHPVIPVIAETEYLKGYAFEVLR